MHTSWLHFDVFTFVSGLAIMIMAVALWKSFLYKATMPEGVVKRTWRLLIALIGLFFVGFLTLPFFVLLPQEWKDNIVAFLFLFGAVYVLVTLNLVYKIVISLKQD